MNVSLGFHYFYSLQELDSFWSSYEDAESEYDPFVDARAASLFIGPVTID